MIRARGVIMRHALRLRLYAGEQAQWNALYGRHLEYSHTHGGASFGPGLGIRQEIRRLHARLVRRARALCRRHTARDEHQEMETRVEDRAHREVQSRLERSA